MYPLDLFNLFPPFPRENTAFVAMSFDPQFDASWQNVLKPAISGTGVTNSGVQTEHLRPVRVDQRKISDSILTEIVAHIARSRFIIADISVIAKHGNLVVRNSNVMYEVGLAHARRLPHEVLL